MRKGALVAFGLLLAAAAGVLAWRGLPGVKWGDVDPAGVVIGLVALAVTVAGTVVAVRLSKRGQWMADTDVDVWAKRLAVRTTRA